jgi:hypothetical protein
MFKRFSFTISLMALGLYAQAQNNSISQIFYLILPIKTEAIPSANMGDGKDFGLTRTSTLGFVPLSTDFNVGIGFGKKFDIQAYLFSRKFKSDKPHYFWKKLRQAVIKLFRLAFFN